MNPRVIAAEYKDHYQLILTFSNKEVRRFDISTYLNYPVYQPLKDEAFCKKVKAANGIIYWNDSIDFDPDTVYLESTPIH